MRHLLGLGLCALLRCGANPSPVDAGPTPSTCEQRKAAHYEIEGARESPTGEDPFCEAPCATDPRCPKAVEP